MPIGTRITGATRGELKGFVAAGSIDDIFDMISFLETVDATSLDSFLALSADNRNKFLQLVGTPAFRYIFAEDTSIREKILCSQNALDLIMRYTHSKYVYAYGLVPQVYFMPTMTSNNSPAHVISASVSNSNAYKAFDKNTSTSWTASGVSDAWLEVYFDFPVFVLAVKFTNLTGINPRLQFYNTATNAWENVWMLPFGTFADGNYECNNTTTNVALVQTPKAGFWRRYRLYSLARNSTVSVSEIEFWLIKQGGV